MTEKTPQIITFGCRLNTYESEVIRDLLKVDATHHSLGNPHDNTIVFNTCGVTAEAERQARQAIRKARRENPEARIIVTGCAAQMNPEKYQKMAEVDLVLGNEEKLQARSYEAQFSDSVLVNMTMPSLKTPGLSLSDSATSPVLAKAYVSDIMSVTDTALHLIHGFENRARAFIQVQNGCNHRCTFCRIPYGRGNSRSVPVGEIVTQVRLLMQKDYQEIVLTGVDITDYGKDLPGQPTLGQMIRRLLNLVPELPRLRLSSIDPVEIDPDLKELICYEPRLMPHLHLSLQAGDNMILKRMKRRHLREDVLRLFEHVKSKRPEVAFGADIIAGFPTETEEMFQNSLKIIQECDVVYPHIFPFSPHAETPAARMPQVARHLIKERAARLRAAGEAQLHSYLDSLIGKTTNILVENDNNGHTESFAPVVMKGNFLNPQIVQGRLIAREGSKLIAEAMG